MRIRDKIKVGTGSIFIMVSLIFLVYFSSIVFNARTFFEIGGWIRAGLIFMTPLLIGSILVLSGIRVRQKRNTVMKAILLVITIFYILAVLGILFFDGSRSFDSMVGTSLYDKLRLDANFVPFKTIIFYVQSFFSGSINKSTVVRNIIANIVLFLPCGFLLPCFFKIFRGYKNLIVYTIIGISVIEIIQFIAGFGSFDIDDIILNVIGAVIGWIIWKHQWSQTLLYKLYILEAHQES